MASKIFSFFLFLFLFPIFSITIIAILIDDGFPVIFKQKRVGRLNKIFWIYKFRTMRLETPDKPTHLLKNSENFYTNLGPFLRKFSLDEIPQLINIIKGDMVFIGPRPALYNQDDLIGLRTEMNIHKIYPGITGWAQINGRDELDINTKVQMDYYYLKNESILLDIKIFFMTIIKVFKKEGVTH